MLCGVRAKVGQETAFFAQEGMALCHGTTTWTQEFQEPLGAGAIRGQAALASVAG